MYRDDVASTNHTEFNPIIRDFISELYIIHTSGIVKFSKTFTRNRYFEPQLIGSFITAIESFMEITAKKLHNDIRLTDLGTTGSRWFMRKSHNVMLVAIVPTDSKFLKLKTGFELIGEICMELMTSFTYNHMENLESYDFVVPESFEEEVKMTIIEKISAYDLV